MHRDLGATPMQISLLIAMHPAVSLLSLYWSAPVSQRPDRLKSNIIWGQVMGYFPFLFIPLFPNPWYCIFSAGIYRLVARGSVPAWMEVLKLSLESSEKKRLFSIGSSISFVGGGLFSLLVGFWMDQQLIDWKYLFTLSALLGLSAIWWQWNIQLTIPLEKLNVKLETFWYRLKKPWVNCCAVLLRRRDFSDYQLAFMLGGFGLVVVQPALPVFFIDVLKLNYTELSASFIFCKGLAFALSSSWWAKVMNRWNIYVFSGYVTLLAVFFPLLLILANYEVAMIYLAYLVYGYMQAGSNMSWHLSGPIFSKEEDSSDFSSVNVAMVGIRGIFAVYIGEVLVQTLGPVPVLLIGAFFSFLAWERMRAYGKVYA